MGFQNGITLRLLTAWSRRAFIHLRRGLRRNQIRIGLNKTHQLAVASQFGVPDHIIAIKFDEILGSPENVGKLLDVYGTLLILRIHLEKIDATQAERRETTEPAEIEVACPQKNRIIRRRAPKELPSNYPDKSDEKNDDYD